MEMGTGMKRSLYRSYRLVIFVATFCCGIASPALGQSPSQSSEDRIDALSRTFLGRPYQLSPLGEEQRPDMDPRFRLDVFDCTTFVETMMALALSTSRDEAKILLDQIRYTEGVVRYEKRRHLMVSQWIPQLSQLGWVEDVTAQIGGSDTAWLDFELTPTRWNQRSVARQLHLRTDQLPLGHYRLPYLPLAVAEAHLSHLRWPAIINVVRKKTPRAPDLITHQGLLLRGSKAELIVRHASPVQQRVVDEKLSVLLARYRKPKKWPVVGFNILRIQAQGRTTPAAAERPPP